MWASYDRSFSTCHVVPKRRWKSDVRSRFQNVRLRPRMHHSYYVRASYHLPAMYHVQAMYHLQALYHVQALHHQHASCKILALHHRHASCKLPASLIHAHPSPHATRHARASATCARRASRGASRSSHARLPALAPPHPHARLEHGPPSCCAPPVWPI